MTVGGRVGALWIGGLEPYMDEAFLQVSMICECQSGRTIEPVEHVTINEALLQSTILCLNT